MVQEKLTDLLVSLVCSMLKRSHSMFIVEVHSEFVFREKFLNIVNIIFGNEVEYFVAFHWNGHRYTADYPVKHLV